MKKIIVTMLCSMLVLVGCSSSKGGKVVEISVDEALQKIENKDTFILMVTRTKCEYCDMMHEMLDKTINDHATIIYNVVMDDSDDATLEADVTKLEEKVAQPGRTPHIYYVLDGVSTEEIVGFNEKNPDRFWEWVKKYELEDVK